jgi:trans-2,3-dihydro-3-hydroxyanthranilate isomerase
VRLDVTVVHACQRAGQGGSPTAVSDDTSLTDAERRAVPGAAGTSHAVFISAGEPVRGRPAVSLRFFTAAGELPACGHGTVAALAVLAQRARAQEYEAALRAGGRAFPGEVAGYGDRFEAVFDPGRVELRAAVTAESEPVISALGLDPGKAVAGCGVASVGRPRMLVEVTGREALAKLAPNIPRLRAVCDRLGLLGCYVYSRPSPGRHAAARMFAPSIGVPEDIANANSTACLAAHIAGQGAVTLNVDMGDSLGQPATVMATARPGPGGPLVRVGGSATISGDVCVT